ncbi:MAG: hypothetical protein K8T91_15225 [Planctomycetes bacterium]|nr:hypothetical protein [Planctomycetota bacterium]
MTDRERWIVYPLLFLALGASLRDKFGGPESIDATRIHCDELSATQIVIADPRDKQPRIVLKSVPGGSQESGTVAQTSGQIELLDGSKRVQTAMAHGAVITHGLKTQVIAVADPAGRTRVQIGTKLEVAAQSKDQAPATSGSVELFGKDNSPLPIVRLAASPEGGFLFTRQDGVPLGVVVGNFQQGSGMFLQVGDQQRPLSGPVTSDEIKKLEKLLTKKPAKPDKPTTKDPEPNPAAVNQEENTSSAPKRDVKQPAKP